MKDIKNLGIKTQEGFEVRNLKRFPSLEWGEEGGLEADLYLNGVWAGTLFQAGEGGCASFTYANRGVEEKELAEKGLAFLKRCDESYGPNSKYKWLRDKTVAKFDDDDIEAIVNTIEEYYDDVKTAAQFFRQGFKAVIVLKSNYKIKYLHSPSVNITMEDAQSYLISHKLDKEYKVDKILRPVKTLNIL